MKLSSTFHALLLGTCLLTFDYTFAAENKICDKVTVEVRDAVTADPTKVLLIVEDAVIANESCACEIVKAAIVASNATPDLTRQIVLTASNVAPSMSATIAECAASIVSTQSGKDVVNVSGKGMKEVSPVQPVEAAAPDYISAPADIRGIYLIQPAAGGIYPGGEKIVYKEKDCPKRSDCSKPISPSCATIAKK